MNHLTLLVLVVYMVGCTLETASASGFWNAENMEFRTTTSPSGRKYSALVVSLPGKESMSFDAKWNNAWADLHIKKQFTFQCHERLRGYNMMVSLYQATTEAIYSMPDMDYLIVLKDNIHPRGDVSDFVKELDARVDEMEKQGGVALWFGPIFHEGGTKSGSSNSLIEPWSGSGAIPSGTPNNAILGTSVVLKRETAEEFANQLQTQLRVKTRFSETAIYNVNSAMADAVKDKGFVSSALLVDQLSSKF